jgi:hypothetical protein
LVSNLLKLSSPEMSSSIGAPRSANERKRSHRTTPVMDQELLVLTQEQEDHLHLMRSRSNLSSLLIIKSWVVQLHCLWRTLRQCCLHPATTGASRPRSSSLSAQRGGMARGSRGTLSLSCPPDQQQRETYRHHGSRNGRESSGRTAHRVESPIVPSLPVELRPTSQTSRSGSIHM